MDEPTLDELIVKNEQLRARKEALEAENYRLRTLECAARSTNPFGPAEFVSLGAWARLARVSSRTAYEFRARWRDPRVPRALHGAPRDCLLR